MVQLKLESFQYYFQQCSQIWVFSGSSRPEMFCEKVFLEMSQNSQKNTCARAAFWKKFIKKRLWHRCFPVNFAKILRAPFLQNTSGRLLLHFESCFVWKFKCFDSGNGNNEWSSNSYVIKNVCKFNVPSIKRGVFEYFLQQYSEADKVTYRSNCVTGLFPFDM